jgi:hypothetical protein
MANQIGTQLVQKVIPLVAGLLVQACDNDARLAPVATALLFATECLLRPPELVGLGAIPARVIDRLAIREHRQRLQAHINADVGAHRPINLWCDLLLNHQADVPVSARIALEGRALGDTSSGRCTTVLISPILGTETDAS